MTRTDPGERPTAAEVVAAASQLGTGDAGGGSVSVTPADARETEVLPSGGSDAHGVTGMTKLMPGAGGATVSRGRMRRILVTVIIGAFVIAVGAVAGVWAATSAGEAPARAIHVVLTKSPPAPVISDEEESPEAPRGDEGKGPKGDDKGDDKGNDKGGPGKKDDED
ncbi:serine/threonine protein kinase [Microbacterium sp. HM58-2]|nr:serine/threonine protein kinase [Microbacterium sp. HM58-2]